MTPPTSAEWAVVEGLLPLIQHIAWRRASVVNAVVSVHDMVQQGVLGALAGLRTFDPQRGQLQAHVARRAEVEMVQFARRYRGPLSMPRRTPAPACDSVDCLSDKQTDRIFAGRGHEPWGSVNDRLDGAAMLDSLNTSSRRRLHVLAQWARGATDAEQAAHMGVSDRRVGQLWREGLAMARKRLGVAA